MSDHPEFPQESPAIKYIVDQVSKVEEATNCSVGYYKSLAKIISRLDKTDIELNRLHQTISVLKDITDSDVIASCIGEKSDEVNKTVTNGLLIISQCMADRVDSRLEKIESKSRESIDQVNVANTKSKEIQKDLKNAVLLITSRLDDHIKDVTTRILPPLWKLWLYAFLTLAAGVAIGKWAI